MSHPSAQEIQEEIRQRMGLCPSFFLLATPMPEILDDLWRQAKAGYLDNPLPSLFKEKLFTYLSRFCPVPYCLARHCAFLLGRGNVAGDHECDPLSPEVVLRLVQQPLPTPGEIDTHLRTLEAIKHPLTEWPQTGGELETGLLACSVLVFLRRGNHERCQSELRRVLGTYRWTHLLSLLAFIRTAHFWTQAHSDLAPEEDVQQLLTEQQDLADWISTCPDVVAEELRQRTEEETSQLRMVRTTLKESNHRLRLLAEAISQVGEGVVITENDLDWPGPRIVFVNEAMCRITGYPPSELIGKTPRLLQGEETSRAALDRIKADLTAGRPCFEQVLNYRRDGTPFHCELFITPLLNAEGEQTNFVSIHRDVTEQKKSEEKLRRQHELSEGIIQTAQHIILLLDTQGRIIRFNPFLENLTGWSLEEVRGRDWFETFLPPQDSDRIRELFKLSVHGRRVRANVNAILTKDGQARDIEWFDASLTNSEGELIGLLCTGRDITERKQAEEALRESEERLRAILETAADAIITITRDGLIDDVNSVTERMFGYGREELVGQNVGILMPSPYREHHNEYLSRYRETGVARIIGSGREVIAQRKDGSTFPVDLAVSEVDHLGLFTGILRDVSRRKELESQLVRIADEEKRRLGQELHDDIGQEVTGIALTADTLKTALSRQSPQATDLGERLIELVQRAQNKIGALSRGLIPVEVDPTGLMTALNALSSRINDLGDVTCEFQCQKAVRVESSEVATHLYHIAQEAVNNALKHGNSRKIHIVLEEEESTVTLRIQDDGLSIDPLQVAEAPGMGLRIMAHRASLAGGALTVGPNGNRGTLVTCMLNGGVHNGERGYSRSQEEDCDRG